jgi:hypothetical protein
VRRCKLEEAEATFRIENFDIAFRANSGPYKQGAVYRERNVFQSKQVMRCGPYEFRFGVAWRLDECLNVTNASTIGLFVEKPEGPPISASLEMTLTNINKDKSRVKVWNMKPYGNTRAWARIDRPFSEGNGSFATLSEVLNKDHGFLHDGALVATYKIQVATQDSSSAERDEHPTNVQMLQTMSADFESLFDSGQNADVQLKVGSETLDCHSLIIAARSPVFNAMLSHDMAEKRSKCIEIQDLDVASVRALIKFLYTGKLEAELEDNDSTIGLLKASHRYEVTDLVQACVQALTRSLTEASAVDRLMVADLLGNVTLRKKCVDFLTASSDRMVAIQQLPEFQEMVKKRPHVMADLLTQLFPCDEASPASKRPRGAKV